MLETGCWRIAGEPYARRCCIGAPMSAPTARRP